jgi:Cyclin
MIFILLNFTSKMSLTYKFTNNEKLINIIIWNLKNNIVDANLFINELITRCNPSYNILIISYILLTRINKYIGRSIYLASLIVADKFINDDCYKNKNWAKLTGIKLIKINLIEKYFLNLINYNVFVSLEQYNIYNYYITYNL